MKEKKSKRILEKETENIKNELPKGMREQLELEELDLGKA